jgi:hypothetical protein
MRDKLAGVLVRISLLWVLPIALFTARVDASPTLLDDGYRAMYDLDFNSAHRLFRAYEATNPQDPIGPVSDAAAYLFAEFDRLNILQSELFVEDSRYSRIESLAADPAVKLAFEDALGRSRHLASAILRRSPDDPNALLATVLRLGLHADYLALVERRSFAALSEMKQGRSTAERLLTRHPECYDAYLAVGAENYLLSLQPAPVRWLLRAGGAQTDKETGLTMLRLTAEQGRYLLPYARLLLALAALRDKDQESAKRTLAWLAAEFPQNRLYREELAKLR